jgi:hypothetical protein
MTCLKPVCPERKGVRSGLVYKGVIGNTRCIENNTLKYGETMANCAAGFISGWII